MIDDYGAIDMAQDASLAKKLLAAFPETLDPRKHRDAYTMATVVLQYQSVATRRRVMVIIGDHLAPNTPPVWLYTLMVVKPPLTCKMIFDGRDMISIFDPDAP